MSWSNDKKLLLRVDAIGWSSLSLTKKKKKISSEHPVSWASYYLLMP